MSEYFYGSFDSGGEELKEDTMTPFLFLKMQS